MVMNAPPDSDLSRIAKSDGFKQHGTAGTSLGGDVSGTGPRYSELKGSSPKSDDPDDTVAPIRSRNGMKGYEMADDFILADDMDGFDLFGGDISESMQGGMGGGFWTSLILRIQMAQLF